VNTEGVTIDRSRVLTIDEWPRPTSYYEVQQFLGFANFYRRFVKDYSRIVGPLTGLLIGSKNGKKQGKLLWTASEEHALLEI